MAESCTFALIPTTTSRKVADGSDTQTSPSGGLVSIWSSSSDGAQQLYSMLQSNVHGLVMVIDGACGVIRRLKR